MLLARAQVRERVEVREVGVLSVEQLRERRRHVRLHGRKSVRLNESASAKTKMRPPRRKQGYSRWNSFVNGDGTSSCTIASASVKTKVRLSRRRSRPKVRPSRQRWNGQQSVKSKEKWSAGQHGQSHKSKLYLRQSIREGRVFKAHRLWCDST